MRRPFAVIGFTWLGVLVAASYAGFALSIALAIFCSVCAVVVLFCIKPEKRRLPAAVFFAAAAAFAAFSFAEYFLYRPVTAFAGKTAQISGVIAEKPTESYGNYYYTIKTNSITVDGKQHNIKTKIRLLSDDELDAEPFDSISASVTLSLPKTKNANGYDSRSYYKSKGVYLFASKAEDIKTAHANSKPPYYYAIKLRQYISGAIEKFVGGQRGSLAAGILIGDTSGLSEDIKNDFSDCGISHLLAVSGTQTSLIMEYLMLLLCALKLPRRVSAAVTAAAVAVFMAVTGFSPSVMRAGIMSILTLCAIIIKRDADVLNSLGLSAFALCFINPYAATDIGLLLSFFATLGMVTVSKRLYALTNSGIEKLPAQIARPVKALSGVLCETIGASALTYPIIILAFGRVSLISLVANMIEVPVSLFVTLATAVLAILSPVWFLVFLIKPIAVLIRLGCDIMIYTARGLADVPFATISAEYGYVNILIVFAAVVFILYFAFRGKGARVAVCVTCICFAVSVGIFSYTVAAHGVMEILPIENTGAAIITSNGHAVVIDLPTSVYNVQNTIVKSLKRRNINYIDAVILTSVDSKKVQVLSDLKRDMGIGKVYAPQNDEGIEDTISVPSKLNAPYGVTVIMLPDRDNANLLTLVYCASSKAMITGSGKFGDFSEYDKSAFKSDLLVCSNNVDPEFASAVSPKNVSCPNDCPKELAAGFLSNEASISTENCLYLTRGGGSYKIISVG